MWQNTFQACRNYFIFNSSNECGTSVRVLINCISNRLPAAFYRVWIGLAGNCISIDIIRTANGTLTDRGFETVANLFQNLIYMQILFPAPVSSKNLIHTWRQRRPSRTRVNLHFLSNTNFRLFFISTIANVRNAFDNCIVVRRSIRLNTGNGDRSNENVCKKNAPVIHISMGRSIAPVWPIWMYHCSYERTAWIL